MPNEMLLTELAQKIYRVINPSNYIAWENYNGSENYIEAAKAVSAHYEKELAELEAKLNDTPSVLETQYRIDKALAQARADERNKWLRAITTEAEKLGVELDEGLSLPDDMALALQQIVDDEKFKSGQPEVKK